MQDLDTIQQSFNPDIEGAPKSAEFEQPEVSLTVVENSLGETASELLTGVQRTPKEAERYRRASDVYKTTVTQFAKDHFETLLEDGESLPIALGGVRDALLDSKGRILRSETVNTLEDSALSRLQEKLARRGRMSSILARLACVGVGIGIAYGFSKGIDVGSTVLGDAIGPDLSKALVYPVGMVLLDKARDLAAKAPVKLGGVLKGGFERYSVKDMVGFKEALVTATTPEAREEIREHFLHEPIIQSSRQSMNAVIGEALTSTEIVEPDELLQKLVACLDDSLDTYYGVSPEAAEKRTRSVVESMGDVAIRFCSNFIPKELRGAAKEVLKKKNTEVSVAIAGWLKKWLGKRRNDNATNNQAA